MWNSKEYSKLKRLYALYLEKKSILFESLEEFTDLVFNNKKLGIFEELMREEAKLPSKYSSRFVRNIGDTSNYRFKGKRVPDMFKCEPEVIFPKEEVYLNYSDMQKKELEANIYKGLAVISARLANYFNRSKDSRPDALTKKIMYMSNFLEFSSKYNSLVKEEDQILFGLKEDPRGAVLLESSLPGYTRFSVHFGSKRNFHRSLLGVNRQLQKDGFSPAFPSFVGRNGEDLISNRVFNRYEYSIPTFGVEYNGIINRDSGSFSKNHLQEYEQLFKKCCRLQNGKVDKGGIEDFLYIYCEDIGEHFNDREIFQLAERAGAGKAILIALKDVIAQRRVLERDSRAKGNDLMAEYIFSMNPRDFTSRVQRACDRSTDSSYDFVNAIVVNLAFEPENHKINEKNLATLLNMAQNTKLRKAIFDTAETEYGEEEPPLKDILIKYLKKPNIHNQMRDIALSVPINGRKKVNRAEIDLLRFLSEGIEQ